MTAEKKDGKVKRVVKPEHQRHCDSCGVTVSSHGWKGHLRSKAHRMKAGLAVVGNGTAEAKRRKLVVGEEFLESFVEGLLAGYERGKRERRIA